MATTKTAAKKAAPKSEAIMAYSMRLKEKTEMHNAIVSKTAKGSWIAKGQDDEGNNISVIMSEETALAHVKAGRAKKAK
jgi:hypothetical protein